MTLKGQQSSWYYHQEQSLLVTDVGY